METDVIKAILSKKEDLLRRHLVLSTSVIEKLFQMDVIGKYTRDQMMGNTSNTDRQFMLLMVCLRTRGLPAFEGFLSVLRMTFHGWLADEILDSTIDTTVADTRPISTRTSVRDFLNRMHHRYFQEQQFKFRPVYISEHEYPYVPYISKQSKNGTEQFDSRRNIRSENLSRRHEYTKSYQPEDKHGNETLISQVPENLRDMQKTFDFEASAVRKSMSVLKQEEITIKSLLQQNLREQQDLLTKQEALLEIKEKMKDLNKTATQLYKPEPDTDATKARLRHLQRTPWSSKQ